MSDNKDDIVVREDASVVYSVRELLDQIRTEQTKGFTRIENTLVNKADKADVVRNTQRLDAHESRLSNIERQQAEDELIERIQQQRDSTKWTTRRKLLTALGTVALILATALGPALGAHIFH